MTVSIYKPRLEEQVRRLERACRNYDSGDVEAGLDIAVTLRLLFYDTGNSTSLCRLMGIKEKIRLPSFVGLGMTKDEEAAKRQAGRHTVSFNLELTTGELPIPITSPYGEQIPDLVPLKDWFVEVVHCDNEVIDRRDLMLCVSHELGGAHVDKETAAAETLRRGVGTWTTTLTSGEVVTVDLQNHHYPLLRSVAAEVLWPRWWIHVIA